jgi:DNA-binding TFAR19-related protein (PDSD5 family)
MYKKIIDIDSGANDAPFVNELEKDYQELWAEVTLFNKGQEAFDKFDKKYPELKYSIIRALLTKDIAQDLGQPIILEPWFIEMVENKLLNDPALGKIKKQIDEILLKLIKSSASNIVL